MPTPLHIAAADPNGFQKVKQLVEAGADLNAVDPKSNLTPVYVAAKFGSLESFVYLIERSDSLSSKEHILYCASADSEKMQYILDPKNKVLEKHKDGTTDLAFAAARGEIEVVSKLMNEYPERLNEKNNFGVSIADFAYYNDQLAVIEFILSHEDFERLPSEEQYKIRDSAAKTADDLTGNADCENRNEIVNLDKQILIARQAHQLSIINMYRSMIASFEKIESKRHSDFLNLAKVYVQLSDEYEQSKKYLDTVTCLKSAIRCQMQVVNPDKNAINKLQMRINALYEMPLLKTMAKWGFECKKITGDADGFFDALIDQLALHQLDCYASLNATTLKESLLEHFLQNKAAYLHMFDKDDTFDMFFDKISKKNATMDYRVIDAVARMLKVTLVIIPDKYEKEADIYKRPHPLATLYLALDNNDNFQSLIPRPDLMEEKSIANRVKKAPISHLSLAEDKIMVSQKRLGSDLDEALPSTKKQKSNNNLDLSIVITSSPQTLFARNDDVRQVSRDEKQEEEPSVSLASQSSR